MKVTDICKEFKVNDDDLFRAKLPMYNLQNPYFKHIPMKMSYRHLVEPLLVNMQNGKKEVRERRRVLQHPLEVAKSELRYR